MGEMPSSGERTFSRFAKRRFERGSDPVSATPNQPRSVPKNGYSTPVAANARPSVASTPDRRGGVPVHRIAASVISEIQHNLMERPHPLDNLAGREDNKKPGTTAAHRPPAPTQHRECN